MRALTAAVAIIIPAGSAFAHGDGDPIDPGDVWHHWSAEPWIVVSLALAFALYGCGVWRIWSHAGSGRGISFSRVTSYALGGATLVVALASPIDPLGGTLLSAHMVQHILLIGVAPPLLLAGLPGVALPWSLPKNARRALGRSPGLRKIAGRSSFLIRPLPAAALHGAALWIWHAPALFEAALRNEFIHSVEHISFFATAMLFWQSIAFAARSATTIPGGIAASFLTLLHGGFLSVLIIFSPALLYPWYQGTSQLWGLDALSDQQLAGLIMGVPASFVYLLTCLGLAARLLVPTPAYCEGRNDASM
ncbi:cytochrome c oxidase assembly protein [Microvirga sp. GCM10011540]|uniref:cytochrome c oxidase assembly protein n=1 Tax=Microvirga sp. GCM10011540 TaxID=3317338 RepID=UPI003613FC2E